MHKVVLSIFLFVIVFQGITLSQLSEPQPRRIGYLSMNAVSISFYDDGTMAGFNLGVDKRGEWPVGSGYNYIGDMTPMIGIEIVNSLGDTVHPVIISRGPRYGQSLEKDPLDGHFWGFNPLPGYVNTAQPWIAMSNLPSSWPAVWADHPDWGLGIWNGFKGPDQFYFDGEAYFQLTDTWDHEFNTYFKPDTTDSTITGYGITVGVRYFQMAHPLYENMIIRMFDIKNNSDRTYEKVVWGNLTGSMAGGDGDSGDDITYFNAHNNIICSGDNDGIGNTGQKVAYFAEGFLQTPGDGSTGSCRVFNIAGSPDMSNDEVLWNRLAPGELDTAIIPQDCDYIYGTNYFSLAPGETKRVVVALAFGYSLSAITQEILDARALWNSQFNFTEMLNAITFLNMDYHRVLSGIDTIRWTSSKSGGSVDVWYSPDSGATWDQLETAIPNTGSYQLNTNDLEDSPFCNFKLFIRDSLDNIYGFTQSHAVTVNSGRNGKPYIRILNPELFTHDEITVPTLDLRMLIGDAEEGALNVGLYYSTDNGFNYQEIENYSTISDTVSHIHTISLHSLSNSVTAKLKVIVLDDSSSSVDTTDTFSKMTPRTTLDTSMARHIAGYCTIPYQINIVDSSKISNDAYLVTFDDTTSQKFMTVKNTSSGINLIDHEPFYSNVESAVFDGLTLYAQDVPTQMDMGKSGWNAEAARKLNYSFSRFILATSGSGTAYNGYTLANDYQIIFYPDTVDTSLADTLYPPSSMIPARQVNYKVKNLSTDNYIDFVYWKTGTLSTTFNIYFKEDVGTIKKRTWKLSMYDATAGASLPTSDTLTIRTIKGLSFLDSIMIGIQSDVQNHEIVPREYKIVQNYPNPFNPVTTIKYQLPEVSRVRISIYNIVGQLVSTLTDDVIQPGYMSVEWNGGDVATGIYFYRFEASNLTTHKVQYTKTGKMVLIK
jgi:hypothetical protein